MLIPPYRIKCPQAGQGVNPWIFNRARYLYEDCGVGEDETREALTRETADCGRGTVQDIEHALDTLRRDGPTTAAPGFAKPRRGRKPPWPPLDAVWRVDMIDAHRKWGRRAWLDANEWRGSEGEALLKVFGGADRLVCLGADRKHFRTDRLGQFLRQERLEDLEYIVPNPMVRAQGKAQKGHDSPRCLGNVTSRRWYLVVEFDSWSFDEQCMLHKYLSGLRELVMLVYSGNRSVHGWYLAYDFDETANREFMAAAVRVGGDGALWSPCQLTRLPGGTNKKTRSLQELIWLKQFGLAQANSQKERHDEQIQNDGVRHPTGFGGGNPGGSGGGG
jgi:hypothetical protein